jgi:hypothetical protein
MNSDPSLNRQSFEAFLADAFAVQQSGLDAQSLSAIVDVQRFLATSEFDADRALHLIAERALKIANASGIAIALLESNQLVYRAGSGSAVVEIGRHVPAVLSARNEVEAEILRVEDADNDSRVQAQICRQFGATSLLILPIYDKQAIAGVLQVHFNEAHVFLNREVLAYRMMAGLVEEALTRDLQFSLTGASSEQSGTEMESNPSPRHVSSAMDEPAQAAHGVSLYPAAARNWGGLTTEWTRRLPQIVHRLFGTKIWPVAAAISAGVVLAFAIRIGHDHYSASAKMGSTSVIPVKSSETFSPSPTDVSTKGPNPTTRSGVSPSSAFRRVQVGPNEVDYVADDVTIRHFTNRSAQSQTATGIRRVDIGDDVTIRYFSKQSTLDSKNIPIPASERAK